MADVLPIVRHLLVCEDLIHDPANPQCVTLVNLIGHIRSPSQPPFPYRRAELCVFVQLTEGRGGGDAWIAVEQADTERTIFRTPTHRVSFGLNPLEVSGVSFRIRKGTFPSPGLYWVQFWYNGKIAAREPLVLE
ncbi:MAG TPA: hypothetical protein VH575_07850 [Gemmataceae bacterium]|jgi:hypothetical protein